jgi:hypothetical protein
MLCGSISEGMTAGYTYDFGTSTELTIKAEYEAQVANPELKILMRNLTPFIPCASCKKNTIVIIDETFTHKCESCNEEDEVPEEMTLESITKFKRGKSLWFETESQFFLDLILKMKVPISDLQSL